MIGASMPSKSVTEVRRRDADRRTNEEEEDDDEDDEIMIMLRGSYSSLLYMNQSVKLTLEKDGFFPKRAARMREIV